MIALTIDTATGICAAALNDIDTGETLAEISRDIGRGHAELLMELIEQCLSTADAEYQDIDRIISTIGPGSFTGIRVGLSAARAMAIALAKPVIGISNLHACAQYALQSDNSGEPRRNVSVILDARRGEVYFQQFSKQGPIGEATVSTLAKLARSKINNTILCGTAAGAYVDEMKNTGDDCNLIIAHHQATAPIEIIAALGMAAPVPTSRPLPLYLRGADAKPQRGFALPRANPADTSARK